MGFEGRKFQTAAYFLSVSLYRSAMILTVQDPVSRGNDWFFAISEPLWVQLISHHMREEGNAKTIFAPEKPSEKMKYFKMTKCFVFCGSHPFSVSDLRNFYQAHSTCTGRAEHHAHTRLLPSHRGEGAVSLSHVRGRAQTSHSEHVDSHQSHPRRWAPSATEGSKDSALESAREKVRSAGSEVTEGSRRMACRRKAWSDLEGVPPALSLAFKWQFRSCCQTSRRWVTSFFLRKKKN